VGSEGSFLVEDFINAITTQLDRVQDSLRLKAVNRPLTYALKDIALDLNVFVEVDAQGNVRFRSSSPNEEGASTIRLGFTTITRPMIEENTVSLAMTGSPQLEEMGLDEEERKRLENLGVRNAAQLQNLQKQVRSSSGVSRLTGIPAERLKTMLSFGKPQVTQIVPNQPSIPVKPSPTPQQPPKPAPPVFVPPKAPPVVKPSPVVQPPPVFHQPPVVHQPNVGLPRTGIVPPPTAPKPSAEPIRIAPGTRRLNLHGKNLVGEQGMPEIRLNNKPLNIADADDDYMVIEMPEEAESGALEIFMPGGEQMLYELSYHDEDEQFQDENGAAWTDENEYESLGRDSWEPERNY
jgi:hypothetical protein